MKMRTLLLATALLVCSISTAQAEWVYETIASSGDQGRWASVAVDSDYRPHAVWYDTSNARLMYGMRNFDGWAVTVVDTGNVGTYCSIAINPATDEPAISYHDNGNQKLRYAWYDGAWHDEQINWDDDEIEGEWTDIVFTDDGMPYISYHHDNGAFQTTGIDLVWKTGGVWRGQRVDSNVWAWQQGRHTTITMDSAGFPVFAYLNDPWDISFPDYRYQKWGYLDGTGWHTGDTMGADLAGEWAGIALDVGDNPYISHYDYEVLGGREDCASLFIRFSGVWTREVVECGDGEFGKFTSIGMDSADQAHITYVGVQTLQYAIRTDVETFEIFTLVDSDAEAPEHTNLALDDLDNVYIVYYNSIAKDMKFIFEMYEPTVLSIDPDNGLNTGPVTGVTITGNTFTSDSTASLVNDKAEIVATNVVVASESELTCDFDLTGVPVGNYDVVVENTVGPGALTDGFLVNTLPPILTTVNPESGQNDNTNFDLALTGQYFTAAMTVKLGTTQAGSVQLQSTTAAHAFFDLTPLPTGTYDVKIETVYGQSVLDDAFAVTCGAPAADFDTDPVFGYAPLTVNFTDTSAGTVSCGIDSWAWDFGDGGTDTIQNPTHEYVKAGIYTVTLTVTSGSLSDQERKNAVIEVAKPEPDDDDDTGGDDDDDDDDDNDDSTRVDESGGDSSGCGC